MRTSNTRARKFGSTVGKIVMALVFAFMIGAILITPAFSVESYGRGDYNQQGRYGRGQYNQQGRYQHGRRVYQPRTYYYSPPVYAPPLDYYVPTPSPGISIIFPIIIR
jgi:hypothetical protein